MRVPNNSLFTSNHLTASSWESDVRTNEQFEVHWLVIVYIFVVSIITEKVVLKLTPKLWNCKFCSTDWANLTIYGGMTMWRDIRWDDIRGKVDREPGYETATKRQEPRSKPQEVCVYVTEVVVCPLGYVAALVFPVFWNGDAWNSINLLGPLSDTIWRCYRCTGM